MRKKSESAVKEEVKQRLSEIKSLERDAKEEGLTFSCLSEKELELKIRGVTSNSPYIYAQSWTSGTTMGSSATYRVYVSNPDPTGYYPLFVSIFFGVANFVSQDNIEEAISSGNFNGTSQFPYLSTRPFSLASASTTNKIFTYTTPTGIPPSNYIGNAVLWQGSYHDKGKYLDRGLFYINLS